MAQIPHEAIDRCKSSVDLVSLVQSHGIELKKQGRNWVGLCPFHEEKTGSFTVNPRTNLYHCFGCDEGGDVIAFVMKRRGVGFREAVEDLMGERETKPRTPASAPAATDKRAEARRLKLLERVATYYGGRFRSQPEGRAYLASRGIQNGEVLEGHGAGYCDGTLLDNAPDDATVQADLKALGVITERGAELFRGCVVFPLRAENGATVGLYGRRIKDGQVDHLYLPGPRRGLAGRCGIGGTVVLCESVLDALTLRCHGITALGCYGVQGFTEDHLSILNRPQVSDVVLCFDGDTAGREAAERVASRLRGVGKPVRVVDLPDDQDVNAMCAEPDGIERLRKKLEATPSKAESTELATYESTHHGFILRMGERLYEAKGISQQGTQLRVTLKALRVDGRFELSTVDFYSHRSRRWFAELCANLFDIDKDAAQQDLGVVLARVEERQSESAEQAPRIEMSGQDKAEALALLEDPNLLDVVAQDLEVAGYTGERTNKLICYLAAISRKLDEPLSVLIQSRSAAGKSALQEAVLALVPDEDYLHYSRMTDQALFYQREDALVHKLLAIEEAEGMGGAAYSIRAIQSAKRLTVAATGKDPTTGRMLTEEYTVRGPLSVMLTTTRTDFDQETMSRFLCLTVDESAEMTRRIHEAQRLQDTLEGLMQRKTTEQVQSKHHNAQRLLRPLYVVNPYAPKLTFPDHILKTRRDHKKYLGLIKAVAFLHQRQRPIKEVLHAGEMLSYIEATLEDIAVANDLAAAVLSQSYSDLTPQAQRLLAITREMLRNSGNGKPKRVFTRRQLREYSHWGDWQVRTHLAELVELEHVHVRQGQMGREYVYQLDGSVDEDEGIVFGLTETSQLLAALGGCSVNLEAKWAP